MKVEHIRKVKRAGMVDRMEEGVRTASEDKIETREVDRMEYKIVAIIEANSLTI